MSTPGLIDLLNELEDMPHATRMRYMVNLGKIAVNDSATSLLIETLKAGDAYQRLLALESVHGSRDGSYALQLLDDPSRTLRYRAARIVPTVCTDEQISRAFANLQPQLALLFTAQLAKWKRHQLVDAYLNTLEPYPFACLLAHGSKQYVHTHIGGIEYTDSFIWRRLADSYPAVTAQSLIDRAKQATAIDKRLLWQVNGALPMLAKRVPKEAFSLVQHMVVHVTPGDLNLGTLRKSFPNEVVDLCLAAVQQPIGNLSVRKLDAEHYARLLQLKWLYVEDTLRYRPLAERRALYDAFHAMWRDENGIITRDILALLPDDIRESEARKHLASSLLATRPLQLIPYAALLPWHEALAVLQPFLNNPNAQFRSAALAALTYSVRFARGQHATDLLPLLQAHRHEQDPVRSAFLVQLADLPLRVWKESHLEDLGQVIRDAVDSGQLSWQSKNALERLLLRLFPRFPGWSAGQIPLLVRENPTLNMNGLSSRPSAFEVERLLDGMLPVFRSWAETGQGYRVVQFVRSLGWFYWQVFYHQSREMRTRELDTTHSVSAVETYELLLHVLDHTPEFGVADKFLSSIQSRFESEKIIDRLLNQDPAWIVVPVVYNYLLRKQPQRLTPYLSGGDYSRWGGEFMQSIVPLNHGLYRLTAAQQKNYAEALIRLATHPNVQIRQVRMYLEWFTRLLVSDPTPLIALAVDERVALRDTAIYALGRLDSGEGLPALIGMLDDERARIAIYALQHTILTQPRDRALELLRRVPVTQVTVAKEVVRLLGSLHTDAALGELLAWHTRALHRDVRVALIGALWNYPQHPDAWEMLLQAAQDEDAVVATAVLQMPLKTYARKVPHAALFSLLLNHQEPIVRIGAVQKCAFLVDPEQKLFTPLLIALNSPNGDESTAAAIAITNLYRGNPEAITRAVEYILPNRRGLLALHDSLRGLTSADPLRHSDLIHSVIRTLTPDPITAALRVHLAVFGLVWSDVGDILQEMANTRELHADALQKAITSFEEANFRIDFDDSFDQLERRFATNPDRYIRRLGLAVLQTAVRQHGWTPEYKRRLKEYQEDSAALVAAEAQFIFPPED
jgi:HEAT repeat protein